MITRSSAYVYFLETVVGRSEMQMLKRMAARTDPCGTPFLRRRNLLLLPFQVVAKKLSSMFCVSRVTWSMADLPC